MTHVRASVAVAAEMSIPPPPPSFHFFLRAKHRSKTAACTKRRFLVIAVYKELNKKRGSVGQHKRFLLALGRTKNKNTQLLSLCEQSDSRSSPLPPRRETFCFMILVLQRWRPDW